MGIILRAMTSTDDAEIKQCLKWLKGTHANTGFMHESFNKDNPEDYVNRTMEKVYRSWHFPPSKPLSEPLEPSPYEEPSDSFRSSFRLRLR